jgi:hypothetical protein
MSLQPHKAKAASKEPVGREKRWSIVQPKCKIRTKVWGLCGESNIGDKATQGTKSYVAEIVGQGVKEGDVGGVQKPNNLNYTS